MGRVKATLPAMGRMEFTGGSDSVKSGRPSSWDSQLSSKKKK
jgi:hypothetical protein